MISAFQEIDLGESFKTNETVAQALKAENVGLSDWF